MSIKGRNNKDIDYFSIIHTLRTFDIELENIISLRESEKFFSKVMSYIYTNSILADYFKEQLQIFLNTIYMDKNDIPTFIDEMDEFMYNSTTYGKGNRLNINS